MGVGHGASRVWMVIGLSVTTFLLFGPVAVRAVAQDVAIDFDTTGPTADDQLEDFFDFLGFDNCVGADPCWNIAANAIDPDDGSNALHTFSDGGQLENWFSRVAILKSDVFTGENIELAVDLTYDSRSDANDHAGVYFRFNGDSDVPRENSYYFLRIDGCNQDRSDDSPIALHRVKDGAEQTIASATSDPFKVCMGDSVRLAVRAIGNQIFVSINGEPVSSMNPAVDSSPLLGEGRVGLGQNTNPAFFDNLEVSRVVVPCNIIRSVSQSSYLPGDRIDVTLSLRDPQGETTIVETVPDGFTVIDAGAGTLDANTITFVASENADFAYSVTAGDVCASATLSAEVTGPGCDVGIGDSTIHCGIQPSGGLTHLLQIGPIDPGRNTDPGGAGLCDDGGRLAATDYLINADGSVGEHNLLVGLGDMVTPDFGGMADAAGVKEAPNTGINPDRANGILTVWLSDADSDGGINFNDGDNIGDADDVVHYSLVYLINNDEGCLDAVLEVGSDDAVKVILNGEVVHARAVCRGVPGAGSGDRVAVSLVPGPNVVLIATVERGGGHGVRLIVRNPDDSPLTDGRVTASFTPPASFPTRPIADVTCSIPADSHMAGDTVSVTLNAANVLGETTITETLPVGWNVTDNGGGTVEGGDLVGTDFDGSAPMTNDDLVAVFELLGHDATVGGDNGWRIEANGENPSNGSNALYTPSDGGQLENWFSRVAVAREEIFSAQNVEFSADITFDSRVDSNDHAGLYVRFNGSSDVPLENSFYFVRIDACDIDRSNDSTIALHRVRDGVHEQLISVANSPVKVCHGDTVTLAVRAVDNEISVWVNGAPVAGMAPFVDTRPLLGPGRVGVGQNTNPAYFDNLVAAAIETISFALSADGSVGYTLTAPDSSPATVEISGLVSSANGCRATVGGDSVISFELASAQLAGDCNQDGVRDVADLSCYVGSLFPGFLLLNPSPPESPCATDAGDLAVLDVSGDGSVNTSDIVSLAQYLFAGGAPPAAGESCFGILEEVCRQNIGCE